MEANHVKKQLPFKFLGQLPGKGSHQASPASPSPHRQSSGLEEEQLGGRTLINEDPHTWAVPLPKGAAQAVTSSADGIRGVCMTVSPAGQVTTATLEDTPELCSAAKNYEALLG